MQGVPQGIGKLVLKLIMHEPEPLVFPVTEHYRSMIQLTGRQIYQYGADFLCAIHLKHLGQPVVDCGAGFPESKVASQNFRTFPGQCLQVRCGVLAQIMEKRISWGHGATISRGLLCVNSGYQRGIRGGGCRWSLRGSCGIFREEMRSTDNYTVPEEVVELPGDEQYTEGYLQQSLIHRLMIWIRVWVSGQPLATVLRQNELRRLQATLQRSWGDVIDVPRAMLLAGFFDPVRELGRRVAPMRPVLDAVSRGTNAAFLQAMLAVRDPEVAQQLRTAAELPPELLDNPAITAREATATLHRRVDEALQIHEKVIRRHLGSVLLAMHGMAALAQVNWETLMPVGEKTVQSRIPLRAVRDDLVELYRHLVFCAAFPALDALTTAAEFASRKLGRQFSVSRDLWSHIDEVLRVIPLEDLVRLAREEPRLVVRQVSHDTGDWWSTFAASLQEHLNGGPTLLRQRTMKIESLLRDDYHVNSPPPTWIPVALYQRSAGAVRRLALGDDFRRTRVLVGSISREENLLNGASRKRLLQAHVELDQRIDELEELIGTGDIRGKIGDELNRLKEGAQDKSIQRMQQTALVGRYRHRIGSILDNALNSLETIHQVCSSEYRTIARAIPQVGAVVAESLGDTSPRVVLDLIVQRYPQLVGTLRGLSILEAELTFTSEE